MPSTYRNSRERAVPWRRFFVGMLLLGAAAAGLTAWPRISFWQQARFADGLADFAERSADGAAVSTVRRLGESGLPAVDALVRLAGLPRPAVAAAAQDELLDAVALWEGEHRAYGDGQLLGRRLTALAESMARRGDQYDESARRWAGGMTSEIVELASAVPAEQAMTLLAWCDAAPTRGARRDEAPRPLPTLPAATEAVVESAAAPPLPSAAAAVEQALPAVPAPLANGGASDLAVLGDGSARGTGLAIKGDEGSSEDWPIVGEMPREEVDQVMPTESASAAVESQRLPAPPAAAAVVDVPSPQQVRANLRRWRLASDEELAGRLQSASRYEALAIATVLRERSVGGARLAAAWKQQEANAGRSEFDGLNQLPAADARRRLRELVSDADPEVRLRALSLLATSGDPQLDAIVRKSAVEDADPRVAELATKILREGSVR